MLVSALGYQKIVYMKLGVIPICQDNFNYASYLFITRKLFVTVTRCNYLFVIIRKSIVNVFIYFILSGLSNQKSYLYTFIMDFIIISIQHIHISIHIITVEYKLNNLLYIKDSCFLYSSFQ